MPSVGEIYGFLKEFAPLEMKMDFDNPGLLVGSERNEVNKVFVALDITTEVIAEAKRIGADLIVSHHPLFFSIKRVVDSDLIGKKIIELISSGISAVCMHTNLDAAVGGVNDELAKTVGISSLEMLTVDGILADGTKYCIGRMGFVETETDFGEYLKFVMTALDSKGLRYYDAGKPVKKVAVMGGSGGSAMHLAIEQVCDTYITADVKYDTFLDAKEFGLNIIDADHFCTENVVVPKLVEILSEKFSTVTVVPSTAHSQTVSFISKN